MKERSYFYKEKFVLRVIGISFAEYEPLWYKIYSAIALFLFIYSYPLLALNDLFKHDFDTGADILFYELGSFMGMAKTTILLYNRFKFGKILDKLQQPPFLPNPQRGGDKEDKIMKECLKITKIQTLTYWILLVVGVPPSILLSLYKRLSSSNYGNWSFTYGPLTFINATYSPNFEILWLYQNVSIVLIGAHFVTTTLILVSVVTHITYQFKMLQNYIRRSVENSNKLMDEEFQSKSLNPSLVSWKFLKVTLKDIVNYHLSIINISREIEEAINGLLLFMCFGTIGMVCFSTYRASLIFSDGLALLRTLLEMAGGLVQIAMLSFWGEELICESQNVGRAAFEANLVGTDIRYQKGLLMIMRRSLNPTKLTAGKFSTVNLPTFVWFLKTSYSMFMVLYNSNKKQLKQKTF